MNQQMKWEIEKIIEVANSLQLTGSTPASTGERIATAFVLNNQTYLPEDYNDMVEAWDRLGEDWQAHMREIKAHYMRLIQEEGA